MAPKNKPDPKPEPKTEFAYAFPKGAHGYNVVRYTLVDGVVTETEVLAHDVLDMTSVLSMRIKRSMFLGEAF